LERAIAVPTAARSTPRRVRLPYRSSRSAPRSRHGPAFAARGRLPGGRNGVDESRHVEGRPACADSWHSGAARLQLPARHRTRGGGAGNGPSGSISADRNARTGARRHSVV